MSDLAFSLSGVGIQYPHFSLRDISLELEMGSILGLIGPNGAGKSTTLRILMGLLTPDSGQVEVLGKTIPSQANEAKWDVGYVSEDMGLYKSKTLRWHMQYMQSIFDNWDEQYAETLLEHFDLIAEQKLKGFSTGQRVKAKLLLALARKPKLLILDEPTTGLDAVARKEVLNELMEVMLDENRSVIFSSHNTQDVEQLSDKIAFIDRGKLVAFDDKESFLERWRRVRIEVDESVNLEVIPNLIEQKRSGKLAVLTTNRYDEAFINKLTTTSASIMATETLTLEEIFVAEVFAGRNGAAQ